MNRRSFLRPIITGGLAVLLGKIVTQNEMASMGIGEDIEDSILRGEDYIISCGADGCKVTKLHEFEKSEFEMLKLNREIESGRN